MKKLFTFLVFAVLASPLWAETQVALQTLKWGKAIEAFEAADKASPPPQGGILFIGASGIARWKTLKDDFPGLPVFNRGFGGSQIEDSTFYADRIIIPYHPKTIVFQAGGNDINAGKSPEQVAKNFEAFVAKVRSALPEVRIIFLGQGPSAARWEQRDKQQALNELVKTIIAKDKNMVFVDMWKKFLGFDGKPNNDLFVEDKLHHNLNGYKLRTLLLKPVLEGK